MIQRLPIIFFVLALFCGHTLSAQISILLVDDSEDDFDNTANLTTSLDAASIAYDYYDAPAEGISPDLATLETYDLVIWHCSNDDTDLYLWNGNETDNLDLKAYLAGGGNLWLIGNDFMFDRYGAPPTLYSDGDFVYDYLGVLSYDGQSRGDDGVGGELGPGVAEVVPAMDQPIPGLVNVDWIFATLWWADAVTPRDGGVTIYEMGGDDTYPLLGQSTGVWYDNGSSICLSFFFDLALASNQDVIQPVIEGVVSFFEGQITSAEQLDRPSAKLAANPTLVRESVQINFELPIASNVNCQIIDATGRSVATIFTNEWMMAGYYQEMWTPDAKLATGTYFVQLQTDDNILVQPLILSR